MRKTSLIYLPGFSWVIGVSRQHSKPLTVHSCKLSFIYLDSHQPVPWKEQKVTPALTLPQPHLQKQELGSTLAGSSSPGFSAFMPPLLPILSLWNPILSLNEYPPIWIGQKCVYPLILPLHLLGVNLLENLENKLWDRTRGFCFPCKCAAVSVPWDSPDQGSLSWCWNSRRLDAPGSGSPSPESSVVNWIQKSENYVLLSGAAQKWQGGSRSFLQQ